MLIFGEAHLRQILTSYASYYNNLAHTYRCTRMRRWVRAVQQYGTIAHPPVLSAPVVRYARI